MTLSNAARAVRDMDACICSPSERVGRITTSLDDGEASTSVCGLAAHRDAAERWIRAITKGEPVFVPDKVRTP